MTRKGETQRSPYEAACQAGRAAASRGEPRRSPYHNRGHSAPYTEYWLRGYDEALADAIPTPRTCEEAEAIATSPDELAALLLRISRERPDLEGARALLRLINMDAQTRDV